jgi:peptidyl-prolyl cis-trans isomerase A (cyclophilin A)
MAQSTEFANLESADADEQLEQPLRSGAFEEPVPSRGMRKVVAAVGLLCVAFLVLALSSWTAGSASDRSGADSDALTGLQAAGNYMTITTTAGVIQVMFEPQAPQTVAKMKQIIGAGLYNNCVFYRAEPGFVVQGGLRDASGTVKTSPYGTFPLEANVPNTQGTVAMARTNDPNSGSGEFFINLRDSPNLDAGAMGPGYTVFGHVQQGMDVAQRISTMPTTAQGSIHMLNTPVTISSIVVQ